jgi:ComF family protein
VAYGYPWSGCIARFKFNGEAGWARAFAMLMRSAPWVEPALDGRPGAAHATGVQRLRGRGFNQALLLARRLAPDKTDATLLLRTRDTPAQHSLPRAERLRNVQGAFALDPLRRSSLRGQRVVLVDDVMTSGASLHAAARVLREAGAAHVTALVLARTDEPGAAQ